MKSGNQDALDLEPTMLAHLFRVLTDIAAESCGGVSEDIAPGYYPGPEEGCDDGSQWEGESAVSGATPPEGDGDEWDYVSAVRATSPRYEWSRSTGLLVQRLDGDAVDCDVPGYGPGTSVEDARAFVARAQGTLIEYP